jgi:hypothetical protein
LILLLIYKKSNNFECLHVSNVIMFFFAFCFLENQNGKEKCNFVLLTVCSF